MECLSPVIITQDDSRGVRRVPVPCGKCAACLSNRRSDWAFRLEMELKYCKSCAYFVTITYDDEHLPRAENGTPTLCKRDVQLFFKKFRKEFPDEKLRYFLVGEYGTDFKRPHYHFLLFGVHCDLASFEARLRVWRNGYYYVGTVTPRSIRYCANYCISVGDEPEGAEPVFCLMSKGLGKRYIDRFGDWNRAGQRFYSVPYKGEFRRLPRFYRDRIFDDSDIRRHGEEVQKDKQIERQEFIDNNTDWAHLEVAQREAFVSRAKKRLVKSHKF